MLQPQEIIERLRMADQQLQKIEGAINLATANGDTAMAEKLRMDRHRLMAMQQKFKESVASAYAVHKVQGQVPRNEQQQNAGTSNAARNAPALASLQAPPPTHPVRPPSTHLEPQVSSVGLGDSNFLPDAQHMQARPPSSNFTPHPNSNPGTNPSQIQARAFHPMAHPQMMQLQELTEEQRSKLAYANPLPMGQPQAGMQAAPGSGMPAPMGDNSRQPQTRMVWQGVLTWMGSDAATQGRKEVHVQVAAFLQGGGDRYGFVSMACQLIHRSSSSSSRSETWPTTLALFPSREPAVSVPDLQQWAKRHKPVLCTIQPQARNVDAKVNENHFRSLLQLLISGKIVRSIYPVCLLTSDSLTFTV
jgi:hypothetical protein